MPLITKPDFTYVWASGGAIVAPNDTKKQTGWVAEAPPFQYDNWLQNRQDQMLAHINQRGIPAWDGLTNYEAGGLSYVQGSDGKVYKSVAASGPTTVVSNPTTDLTDTYWIEAFASIGAFLTQTAGDARYTQRSNNLSDITNAATAFTNIKQPASETVTGVVELATQLEVDAGTSDSVVTTPLKMRFGFAISLAANGYIKFPSWLGGLIVQWGYYSGSLDDLTALVTLPITFPAANLGLSVTADGGQSSAGTFVGAGAQKVSTSQFRINGYGNSLPTVGYHWIAIGH